MYNILINFYRKRIEHFQNINSIQIYSNLIRFPFLYSLVSSDYTYNMSHFILLVILE